MLSFEENALIQGLALLSKRRRAAFAAACAERLMPAYREYCSRSMWGDPAALRFILDYFWDVIESGASDESDLQARIERCMELIPGEDRGPWLPERAHAEDAASALAYAMRCFQTGEAQEAAWAARRAYETVDQFVVRRHGLDTEARRNEKRVLSYPPIQNELRRQERDIGALSRMVDDEAALIREVRDRARSEASLVFV